MEMKSEAFTMSSLVTGDDAYIRRVPQQGLTRIRRRLGRSCGKRAIRTWSTWYGMHNNVKCRAIAAAQAARMWRMRDCEARSNQPSHTCAQGSCLEITTPAHSRLCLAVVRTIFPPASHAPQLRSYEHMMTGAFAAGITLPIRRAGPSSACTSRVVPTMAVADASGRRAVLRLGAMLAAGAVVTPAFAGRSSMSGDYKVDAARLLGDMRSACELGRGAPEVAETVSKTRAEMNDFVALYRRNGKVSGSTSFNTLYTAINTLSGHYASYGNQYPVPEKRKKRLNQQFNEIDRALQRGR